jgi:hypothetical protein
VAGESSIDPHLAQLDVVGDGSPKRETIMLQRQNVKPQHGLKLHDVYAL